MREDNFLRIKKIVLIALLGAVLFSAKLALFLFAQVEVVTVSIIAFTYVFGLSVALPATILFVALDTILYGFAPWVISYLIYWPALAIVTSLAKPLISKNKVLFGVLIATIMTLSFGFLTSFVDTLFYSDLGKMIEFFIALYLRGIYFYIVHVVANIVIVAILIEPICLILQKNKDRYFQNNSVIINRRTSASSYKIKSRSKKDKMKLNN